MPIRRGVARVTGAGLACLLLLVTGFAWHASRLPASYPATGMGHPGHVSGHLGESSDPGRSLTELVADPARPADLRVELVARSEGDRYTLNGATPGPTIRAQQGDLIEVVLHNESVPAGTTIHWHGIDVPNAMDGVAGVTQDAVPPGDWFTYRFVAEQAGSYWYHSHQISHQQVIGGLFGALVVEPSDGPIADAVVLLHTYPGESQTLNGRSGEIRQDAISGARVRVRLMNTDNSPTVAWVAGGDYRLVAIDGTDLTGASQVKGQKVTVTAGGRIDLEVRVPAAGAVRIQLPGGSLVLGPAAASAPTSPAPPGLLDPLSYGTPTPLGFDATNPDKVFDYRIGRRPGFLDGKPGVWWTINGRMGRHVPMYLVDEGDVVVFTISNHSGEVHPMHLHGHHFVVLTRNGVPATGSQWWVDSLHVDNGDSYTVAFVADNPGVWMDHCHNLPHAREGLMTHLMYSGISTPFLLGRASGNEPE